MFVGVHAMLAANLEAPELAISEDDGKAFMRSAQNVMRHYSVETTQKTLDWIAFIGTVSGMYAPRITAVAVRRRAERKGTAAPRRQAPQPQQPQSPAPLAIVPDMMGSAGFQNTGE